jgi:endogenous inhibitor of DNA gyrase (YacG/DUF329 family)
MTEIPCPICETTVPGEGDHFPFCSMRCKQIDLGNWFDGAYRIAGSSDEDEEEEPAESYGGRPILPVDVPDGLED